MNYGDLFFRKAKYVDESSFNEFLFPLKHSDTINDLKTIWYTFVIQENLQTNNVEMFYNNFPAFWIIERFVLVSEAE